MRLTRCVPPLLLAGLLGLSGCGDDPGEQSPTSSPTAQESPDPAPPSPPPAEVDEVELFEFEITDGEASPPLTRAEVETGTTVRIVVTSDQADELHLHGYDLTAEVGPGQEGVLEFVADQAGLFELETHDTHLALLQLQVR